MDVRTDPDEVSRKDFPDGPLIWGYVRVSTNKQVESGLGIEHQIKCINRYADYLESKHDGLHLGCLLKEPEGVSASKVDLFNRRAGVKLSQILGRGDHILCGRLDRCFRNPRDFYNTQAVWSRMGVAVHIVDGTSELDLSTELGATVAGMLVFMAEWQSRYISRRVKEANAISRQKLKVQSGPKRLGYKESKHQPGYLVLDKLDHAVLRYTMYCRKQNVAWKAIANRLEEILAKREGRKPLALFWEEKRLYPIHKLKRMREKFLGVGTLDIYDPNVSDAYRASEFYSKKVARDSA
jgi:DNA invertase Pin-like site-specific DNA recombinase